MIPLKKRYKIFCQEPASAHKPCEEDKSQKVLVHLQEFSEPYTEKNGYDHYDQVYCYGGESYLDNTLESQTEAVKDDS